MMYISPMWISKGFLFYFILFYSIVFCPSWLALFSGHSGGGDSGSDGGEGQT